MLVLVTPPNYFVFSELLSRLILLFKEVSTLIGEVDRHHEVGEHEEAEEDETDVREDDLDINIASRVSEGEDADGEDEVDQLHGEDVGIDTSQHIRLLLRQIEQLDRTQQDNDSELQVGWGGPGRTHHENQSCDEPPEEVETRQENPPPAPLVDLEEE